MTRPFFHDLRRDRCKFITGEAATRITSHGPLHVLALACGDPVAAPGAAYCAAHGALTAPAQPPAPLKPPRETMVRRTPAASRPEPDLCTPLEA